MEIYVESVWREPQHFMTTDPDKVWPNGFLPYLIEEKFGKHDHVAIALSCLFTHEMIQN